MTEIQDTTAEAVASNVVLTNAGELHDARLALTDAITRVRDLAFDSDKPMQAYRLGMLAEALGIAENAVFNALSTASSMNDCAASELALEQWHQHMRAKS